MSAKRDYLVTWLVLALGGAGVLFAYRMPWYSATESLSTGGQVEISGSGLDAAPVGAAMGIVVLASALAILVTARMVRRVVAALGAVAALVAAVLAVVWAATNAGGPQISIGTSGNVVGWSVSLWWIAAVVCGLAAAIACGWAAYHSGPWATMSTRYDRGARQPRDAWEALDRGLDPTVDD